MELKNCKDCKLDLDVSNFTKISLICQKCKAVRKYQAGKIYREAHSKDIANYKHNYFIENREKINEKKKIHWEKVDAERIAKRILKQAKLDEQTEYEEVAIVDEQNNIIKVFDV